MRFSAATDQYFDDMRREGRIRSDKTELLYRQVLLAHGEDIGNRDPRTVGRSDIQKTLRRWPHHNTQAARHSALMSFYDWCMTEGIRDTNPARQVRRAKKQPTSVYRLTRVESTAILHAARTIREKRIAYLGICAGIRNAELRGLQGRHFQRPGFVWVSSDIAKGGRERWVPILPELQPIVDDILHHVLPEYHVLPRGSAGGWGPYTFKREDPTLPMSSQTVQRTVHHLAKRAGIAAHIHPHLLRHAFADHIARHVGLKQAQNMLGHADVQTTQRYVGESTLEELAAAIRHLRFADDFLPPSDMGRNARSGEGGIRTLGLDVPSDAGELLESLPAPIRARIEDVTARTLGAYAEAFRA